MGYAELIGAVGAIRRMQLRCALLSVPGASPIVPLFSTLPTSTLAGAMFGVASVAGSKEFTRAYIAP